MTKRDLRIAVFGSGEGTTFQALAEAASWTGARPVLVVSDRPGAGILRRADALKLPSVVLAPSLFRKRKAWDRALARACGEAGAELVCLAGWLRKLGPAFLEAYPDRVLNVHPALLPAFGGKGMYGLRVHEAVLAAGARVSGCTVHLCDEKYDHGPVVAQAAVPVLGGDTAKSLSERVREAERWLYPSAVKHFAEGRVTVRKGVASVKPPRRRALRALLSVSDKTGLVELGRGLSELGVELVATGGTARALEEAGLRVRPVAALTGAPEMLDGRVKTLHPRVHGAILFRRKDQAREAARHGLEPIDLVVVNLYPFEAAAARIKSPWSAELAEEIDIGGPTMLRAAAKSHADVAAVCDPADYPRLLGALRSTGALPDAMRRELSAKAFAHTAAYDRAIASKLGGGAPARQGERLELEKALDLRYGENPHQTAALWRPAGQAPCFEQLQGKELSYNNLLDADAAAALAADLPEPGAAIVKHGNPCGAATGPDAVAAWERAWECDPGSAFGGVVGLNRPVDAALARRLAEPFLEVVAAPGFEPEALRLLQAKKNLRLLVWRGRPRRVLRSVGTELLIQTPDDALYAGEPKAAGRRAPTPEERAALDFAWRVAKHVRSNAIVLALPGRVVGVGAGQMSRVDSVRLAGMKRRVPAGGAPEAEPLALASDAFFPFRDGLDEAAKLGVTAVIQPGGSVRDAEVVAAADEHGIAMLFTGIRHFKH